MYITHSDWVEGESCRETTGKVSSFLKREIKKAVLFIPSLDTVREYDIWSYRSHIVIMGIAQSQDKDLDDIFEPRN